MKSRKVRRGVSVDKVVGRLGRVQGFGRVKVKRVVGMVDNVVGRVGRVDGMVGRVVKVDGSVRLTR